MGLWGRDFVAMKRARAKLSRWPHLAQLRSGEGPGWLQQSRRGVAERRGDKDRAVEGGGAIQGLLEAIAMALTFSRGCSPLGGSSSGRTGGI